jgi:hypothetical protein
VAVVVDGGRHGFHARGTLSSPLRMTISGITPFFFFSRVTVTANNKSFPLFFFLSVLHFFLLIV